MIYILDEVRCLSVLGLQNIERTATDLTNLQTTTEDNSPDPQTAALDSPLGFMDEKTHDVYALGLVETPTLPEANGNLHLNAKDGRSISLRDVHLL